MALNACSINGFTVNTRRCASHFNRLVPILHPAVLPNPVGGPRVYRDTAREAIKYDRPFEIEDTPNLTFEQPIVSVSAEILGFSGTDTQDVSAVQVDFVSVSDLMVADKEIDDALIGVNIFDLRIE